MTNKRANRRKESPAREQGFSLIELLIVVAIILIIAAISIPNLLRSRIAANEASAASSVRTITSSEFTYNAAYPMTGFAADLTSLGGSASSCTPSSTSACILDPSLTTGLKGGYKFAAKGFATGGLNTTFVASSGPQNYGVTGIRKFCMVTDGSMHIHPGDSDTTPAADVPTCVAYPISQ